MREAPTVLDKFEFQKLIEEEGISIPSLPEQIRKKINGFNLQKGRYLNNPTHQALNSLKSFDIKIADEIQDYLEEGLDDEPQTPPTPTPKQTSTPPAPPQESEIGRAHV